MQAEQYIYSRATRTWSMKHRMLPDGTVNLTFVVGFASICQGKSMSVSYKYHRFPIEIIRYCVWLYYTFPLSNFLDTILLRL